MGETTDNINEVISTGGNFALLAEVIEFLKKNKVYKKSHMFYTLAKRYM